MPSILVTGSKGQLGSELQQIYSELAYEWVFTDISDLDITDKAQIVTLFEQKNFDWCINCAAYTQVDRAEIDSVMAYKINEEGAGNLAEVCQRFGTKMIHISTDFVFEGNVNKPIPEFAPLQPLSIYGKSKMAGESAVVKSLSNHLIVRTSWLYSSFGDNFLKTIIRLGKERELLKVIDEQIGTPTHAADLAIALIRIIKQVDEAEYPEKLSGIYHYSNEGVASWYDFAIAIIELAKLKTHVAPIRAVEYPTPAVRPQYSVMSKEKIKQVFGLPIPHWRSSLEKCIKLIEKESN